jgi:hypothetical protein
MEQSFTNEAIDTFTLPKFEEVQLTPIHKDYWKVLLYNIVLSYAAVAAVFAFTIYFIEELHQYALHTAIAFVVIAAVTIFINWISYRNKGYAFRTHDVIYRSGAIALTTTIIPYNRIQHAALHEGWLARRYGLATVGIFTAGSIGSDIKIPGIEKEHAEKIKQLLMGKVVTDESHE